MKHFTMWEIREAIAYAAQGGQAVHTHNVIADRVKAPKCFVREVDAGREICHLFDQDVIRLVKTVRSLGVNVVVVERRGEDCQHVDLCSGPLRKALKMCEADSTDPVTQGELF